MGCLSVTKSGVTTCVTEVESSGHLEGLSLAYKKIPCSIPLTLKFKKKLNRTPHTITSTNDPKTDVEPPPETS